MLQRFVRVRVRHLHRFTWRQGAGTLAALTFTLTFGNRAASAQTQADARVDTLLKVMTVTQKLALMHGGDPGPFAGQVPGIPELGIPPLTLDDGPAGVRHGWSFALPAPIALAATWNSDRATDFGGVLGRDARALGVNALLAPDIDIARVYANGRVFESFGEEPWLASALAVPEIRAIQSAHVIAIAKHYVAYNQQNGVHNQNVEVDPQTLREVYVAPFAAAIREANVGGIMCSYNQIGGAWSCENSETLSILNRDLGFTGFVVSDWYAQHDIYKSLFNGLDLEMPQGIIYGDYLTGAVARGNARIATIDQHVRRLIDTMARIGVLDNPPVTGKLNEADDLLVARRIVDEGAVLLKNQRNCLPILPDTVRSLAVIGPTGAPAVVAGGGSAEVAFDSTAAPSALDAIKAAVGARVTISSADTAPPPFIDDLPTIDALALTPLGRVGSGWLGSYYANPNLEGSPAFSRIDRHLSFSWGTSAPAPSLPLGASVRWSATLRVRTSGLYRLGADGRCACRLSVAGNVVVDSWKISATAPAAPLVAVPLKAGTAYPIVFEWHPGGERFVRLAWQPPQNADAPDIDAAAKVASNADAAVVFVGDFETEGRDRSSLHLSSDQERLIRAVGDANKRTVVVLESGGPVVTAPWIDHVAALLELWYPGEAGGLAAADLLFGNVNPSGKLPLTFPVNDTDVPVTPAPVPERADGPIHTEKYAEGRNVGYRWYDAHHVAPQYPFGFGLSYTRFSVSNLSVVKEAASGNGYQVGVDVVNTGTRGGSTVVQLYVTFPPDAGEPPLLLRGMNKLALEAGEKRNVQFHLKPDAFVIWDQASHAWRSVRGTFTIAVGSSSRDLPLSATVSNP